MPHFERFLLDRIEDETGISGEGLIAEGVKFSDGTVVIRWLTDTKSTTIFQSVADMEAIHGHEGKTVPIWMDRMEIATVEQPEEKQNEED
jgi:hypothetical protein